MWKTPYRYPAKCYTPMNSVLADIFTSFCLLPFLQTHKETTYTLSPEVRTAFYAYDRGLHELMAHSKNEDLDGSYARFPMKALRIAGLLASLHDDASQYTIWPAQWYRGQQIAERWRQSLHTLIGQVQEATEPTATRQLEEGLIRQVKKHGQIG